MATKLTKAFAAFVGERGFEIANEDEISQQPRADYKLARQIFRNKRVLLPFLTKLAVKLRGQNCGDRPQESLIFQCFPDVGPVDTLCLDILCRLSARW